MSHLLRPDGATPTSRSLHPTRGPGIAAAPASPPVPARGVRPLGAPPSRRRRPPLPRCLPPRVRGAAAAPSVPRKETPRKSERSRSRSHPDLAVLITTAGNACPQRVSPGPCPSRVSDPVAGRQQARRGRCSGSRRLARARAGDKSREWCGPGSARSPAPRGAHGESAARQRTPGLSRGFPPAWDPGGSREPRAACAPGPAPLTHTQ